MLNSVDIYGTPLRLMLDSADPGSEVVIVPPTIAYFERLFTMYNLTINQATEIKINDEDALTRIRAMSIVMMLMHTAIIVYQPETTMEDIELYINQDPSLMGRFLGTYVTYITPINQKAAAQKKKKAPVKAKKP